MSTTYETTKPSAGDVKTKLLLCAADTYYVGMPLNYNTTDDDYEYNASTIKAIAYEDKVLASQGYLLCMVTGSEFPKNKLVDDTNATLTVTADMDESARSNGIILR